MLYVDEGDVITGAGSAAGLDLCLHLVRKDHGAAIANAVARRLVIPPHRDGGQAQFIETPVTPRTPTTTGSPAAWPGRWRISPSRSPWRSLARQAHMSTRTYLRHFARGTGTSPIRWLIAQRVRASLPLLEDGGAPVEQIGGRGRLRHRRDLPPPLRPAHAHLPHGLPPRLPHRRGRTRR